MRIVKHDELEVFQRAFAVAMRIFRESQGFPKAEMYSLTDQIRRSSRSVCANIAEAWRKRRYEAHFISKLSDVEAEAAETQVWLDFAMEFEYINEVEFNLLHDKYDHILSQLIIMINSPEKWCH